MIDLKFLKIGLLFAFGMTPLTTIPFLRRNVEKTLTKETTSAFVEKPIEEITLKVLPDKTQNEIAQEQILKESPKEVKNTSKVGMGELKKVVLTDAKGVKRVLVGRVTNSTITNSAGKKIKQVKVTVKKKKSKQQKRK